jgi:hypothetical protein
MPSGKSVAAKLGFKTGVTLLVRHAPATIEAMLGEFPDGATWTTQSRGKFSSILVFVKNQAALTRELKTCRPKLADRGALWIAYAKQTSPLASDLHRDVIHEVAQQAGFDAVSIIAIDSDWTALRLKVA